jgi:hypothetical protein
MKPLPPQWRLRSSGASNTREARSPELESPHARHDNVIPTARG